jgi:hypothetical protein
MRIGYVEACSSEGTSTNGASGGGGGATRRERKGLRRCVS